MKWKTLSIFTLDKVFQNIQQAIFLVIEKQTISKHVRLLILRHLASYY